MDCYDVTFRKHFNRSGEADDYPTDFLRAADGVIENMEYVSTRPPAAGDEYGEEDWRFGVAESRFEEFEDAVERCETAISYRRLSQWER